MPQVGRLVITTLLCGLIDVAELPLDFGKHGVGEGLDDAALLGVGVWGNEWYVAIEDRRADGIFRCGDGRFCAGDEVQRTGG